MAKRKVKKGIKILGLLIILVIVGIFIFFSKDEVKENTKKVIEKIENNTVSSDEIKNSIFKDYYEESRKIVNDMTIEEKIGQLFLVRYDVNEVSNNINYYPGGYLLFAKDFENHTKESIKNEIEKDQSINKYPLIIAVDEEGGYVTRVSKFSSFRNERFLAPKNYYMKGGWELLEEIENEKANLLKSIGINLNLAPVVDLSEDPNDFIYDRSFGYDLETTKLYASNMVKYANNNKINSCLKHFPGYGNNKDTHTGIAIDERSYDEFKNRDFLPFKAGIDAGVPSILVSHNIVKCMDEEYPSSLSKNVIKELRDTLGFTGIIMTDDLAMDAVKEYVENNKAAPLAIIAGNDMIITSDFINMRNQILEAVKNKEISEDTINKAVLRIIAWKYYSGLFEK